MFSSKPIPGFASVFAATHQILESGGGRFWSLEDPDQGRVTDGGARLHRPAAVPLSQSRLILGRVGRYPQGKILAHVGDDDGTSVVIPQYNVASRKGGQS